MARVHRKVGNWAPVKIRELREARGWNRTKLAAECNVTADAVGNWEEGINEPRASNLIALVKALGCALEELTQ